MTVIPFIPFQFDINASATTLTRAEFVADETAEADQLRTAILADPTASIALQNLAADQTTWENLYLAGLEQAGVLLPDGAVPPVSTQPLIMSLMATLATGVLAGPAGSGIISSGNISQFFSQLLAWYGNNTEQTAPDLTFNLHDNPIAVPSTASQFNQNAQLPTNFEDFNVYVPWVAWDQRANLPPSFQINSVQEVNGQPVIPLDLTQYLATGAQDAGLASMTGPFTADQGSTGQGGFIPSGQPLPFTVNFQNDPQASTSPGQIRITTQLDPNLDPRTFRLGDIQVGDIDVSIPSNMSLFQGDFDFTQTKGFILRVSAGVDLQTGIATWLLEAIDPLTGAVITNPNLGLLPPNDAEGDGAGFVTYTVEPLATAPTGATIGAAATVSFNTAPPQNTAPLSYTLDSVAPTTQLTVTQLGASPNYQVTWNSTDNPGGSGVAYVTLYVAEDGGAYQIWQDQLAQASGTMVYQGAAGHTYTFLALATDVAGNHELPPAMANVPQDTTTANLGALPTVPNTTPPNFGIPPAPVVQPSTNPLFTQAQQDVPNAPPASNPSEFQTVLQPFQAQSFATGFQQSDGIIGPMAIAEAPDGNFLVSGGASRNQLFLVPANGGPLGAPLATEPYQIFALAFDSSGNLWATTGGGPLLQLDPTTGAIVNQFGDGVTLALAVDPKTGQIYVSTGSGVDIFDPTTDTFTQYSRDQNLRVSSLAFDNSGNLWAVTWPDASQVVEFDANARAQVKLTFDSDVQSIAFGQTGTYLDNLLFVSHDDAPNTAPGTVASTPTDLTMVDVTTLQQVAVAQGGTRGFDVFATADGRLLISQSHEVDVLDPVVPPNVVSVNPPPESVAALPLPLLSVTFDQDMFVGPSSDTSSVTDPANYVLTGATSGRIAVQAVQYNPISRTALLTVFGLSADQYTLTVSNSIESANLVAMLAPYVTHFTAVSNLAPYVQVSFYDARSDRADGTVSYDVSIKNTAQFSLFLPLYLVLDPAQGFTGVPQDASLNSNGSWLINLSSTVPNGTDLSPGQVTTGQTVTISDPDELKILFSPDVTGSAPGASAPVFVSQPVTSVTAGAVYSYQAQAQDPDGSTPGYLLYSGPAGMTVDATERRGDLGHPAHQPRDGHGRPLRLRPRRELHVAAVCHRRGRRQPRPGHRPAALAALRQGRPAPGVDRQCDRSRRPATRLLGQWPARRGHVRPGQPDPALDAGLRPGRHVQQRHLPRERRGEHRQCQHHALDHLRPSAAAAYRAARPDRARGRPPPLYPAGQRRRRRPGQLFRLGPAGLRFARPQYGRLRLARRLRPAWHVHRLVHCHQRHRSGDHADRDLHRAAGARRADLFAASELAGRRGPADFLHRAGRRSAQPDVRDADPRAGRLALALPDDAAHRDLQRERPAGGRQL